MKIYIGVNNKENMVLAARLGVPAILTNANSILRTYGENTSLKECTQKMLDESDNLPVFPSVHGKDYNDIVRKSLDLCSLSPRVGVKIISTSDGFQAIKILSDMGIKCIATGLYTVWQAVIAAQVNAFAISPFIARGIEYGLDMETTIKTIRKIYDKMESSPEILAASVRTIKDAELAIRAGADSLAIGFPLLLEMLHCQYTELTEVSFGKAFSLIKDEDTSYLDLNMKENPINFIE
ncbi:MULTISPECIES: transaldolase family protein [unclassified Clostridium]|uniref:transaldolase family protein n=1 Tax=unclassified Clostridium TaxID=2614128 RepID=UPI002A758931|nr:transaldolase family protein [Clostridium sp.]MCI6693075.1 hypothetical protein [Clostridium sp.]MDY2632332.1 transaldolase family protein [Clostridium sp.]MDY4252961.1 transaldolase family protein [Clostridium sp.]MDY6226886.1 transaldolase family protein [Clostridium sp.]